MSSAAFRTFLESEFSRRKEINPAYSLRAFSKKLGLPVSALSDFRNGKRALSRASARKALLSLNTPPDQIEPLMQALFRRSQDFTKKQNRDLDEWTFRIVSEWQHFAILSLLECAGEAWTLPRIAQRLGIGREVARECLDRLRQLGMVEELEGSFVVTGRSYHAPDGIPSAMIRKHHREILGLASAAVEASPLTERDFFNSTLAIDPDRIPQAKKMLRKFHQRLTHFLESGKQRRVYSFATQLFELKSYPARAEESAQ